MRFHMGEPMPMPCMYAAWFSTNHRHCRPEQGAKRSFAQTSANLDESSRCTEEFGEAGRGLCRSRTPCIQPSPLARACRALPRVLGSHTAEARGAVWNGWLRRAGRHSRREKYAGVPPGAERGAGGVCARARVCARVCVSVRNTPAICCLLHVVWGGLYEMPPWAVREQLDRLEQPVELQHEAESVAAQRTLHCCRTLHVARFSCAFVLHFRPATTRWVKGPYTSAARRGEARTARTCSDLKRHSLERL